MNLTLFFRLITQVLFNQRGKFYNDSYEGVKPDYSNTHFFCPKVYAKDGFNVSLQINYGNYCASENGYRKLGKTWERVEFGFPSENEPLMWKYSEMWGSNDYSYDDEGEMSVIPFESKEFDVTGTVGSIPLDVMEKVFEKHGGIDWGKSCEFQH